MKKLFTFITLLMAIVMGAQAETAVLYSDGTTANSVTINNFTIAITGNTEKNWSAGNGDVTIEGTAYKTLKNSNGAQNTVTCPDGYVATNITFYAVANNDATPGKLSEIDGTKCDDEVTSLKDYSNPTVISKDIDNKSQFTFTFSSKQVCFAAVVTYKASAPVGPVDPVFSLVKSTIKAGETAQIQVGSKGNLDGIELNNVKFNTLNAIQSLDRQTGVIVLNEGFVGTATFTFDSNSVDNKYNYSENNELTLTVEAAAAAPATPTFDKAAGSTIKVGEPVVITSDDGSQIYYNWSGKATGGYDEAALLGRTPKDSPASCTTSTTGSRYLYALAKKGDGVSDIAIIGYNVEANPVKGQLDKTTDAVDQNAEAPALPVFTVVDANGNASTASIGYGEDTKKDVTVKYEVLASSTPGIVTLKADGSGIESISTATAGEATVSITLTSNKSGYPLVDGEVGIYAYTITVNNAGPVTPTFSFVNNSIGNNQTAQIQVGDKGDMDGIKISEVSFQTQGIESVDLENGVVTPTPGFVGTAIFTIATSASTDGKYSATTNNELTLIITAPVEVDPVFSLVSSEITAGETAQIQVGDKGNLDGIELNNVTFQTLGAFQSIDMQTGAIVLNEGFIGTATFTFDSKSVEGKYNYTENNELTITVNAPAPALDEQTDVTGSTTWDWSSFSTVASAAVELTATTTPAKDEEFVLSNVVAYGLLDNVSADFQALKAKCQWPVRDGKYFQGSEIRFNTTVPGTVKVTFASTGSSKDTHNRDIVINGIIAGNANKTTTMAESDEVNVEAGEVFIKGVLNSDGATGDSQYLRISKIVFTETPSTGVAGVAEEAQAEGTVKVVKDGKIIIVTPNGQFNAAGAQVK